MAKQIKPSDGVSLCDNYDTKYDTLSNLIGTDDNRSCSFSIKELENYLDYIKNAEVGVDGIRIYLGSNIETNLTTMFFAPTVKGKDNTSLDLLNRFIDGYPPKKKYTI